jgi:hypothetical protein
MTFCKLLIRCIATNSKGSAETKSNIVVASIVDSVAPQIIQPLQPAIENVEEGEKIHMECRIIPINDANLSVQWLHNGIPLSQASRFKMVFEFGYISLDILFAYPEDSGEYTVQIANDSGECETRTSVNVCRNMLLIYV